MTADRMDYSPYYTGETDDHARDVMLPLLTYRRKEQGWKITRRRTMEIADKRGRRAVFRMVYRPTGDRAIYETDVFDIGGKEIGRCAGIYPNGVLDFAEDLLFGW